MMQYLEAQNGKSVRRVRISVEIVAFTFAQIPLRGCMNEFFSLRIYISDIEGQTGLSSRGWQPVQKKRRQL